MWPRHMQACPWHFSLEKKPFFFLVLQYSHLIVLLTSLLVLYGIKEELRNIYFKGETNKTRFFWLRERKCFPVESTSKMILSKWEMMHLKKSFLHRVDEPHRKLSSAHGQPPSRRKNKMSTWSSWKDTERLPAPKRCFCWLRERV